MAISKEVLDLWKSFDVPIDEDWHIFKKGTDRYYIMHWFEGFGVSVHDLMFSHYSNMYEGDSYGRTSGFYCSVYSDSLLLRTAGGKT